jgi:hypothetical protein
MSIVLRTALPADEPVISRTFTDFDMMTDISLFFDEAEDRLPAFRGESIDECLAVFAALDRKVFWAQWRRAAIASTLERRAGQRSREITPIKAFCEKNGIEPATLSRLARTYRAFDQRPLDPRIKELLKSPVLKFKHWMIAASCSINPPVALREAHEQGWTTTQFEVFIASQKNLRLVDPKTGNDVKATDDDGDVDVDTTSGLPERPVKSTARPTDTCQLISGLVTRKQFRIFSDQVRDLRAALGTEGHLATVLAAVDRLHAELVGSRKTEAA